MKVSTNIKINSTKENVWNIITDIENSVNVISGIIKIEIINPTDNLIGLKWKETRVMFGKEADEVMWITHAKKNEYYQTRAESHGSIYISRLSITKEIDSVDLEMSFESQGSSFMTKIMNGLFGGVLKKSMKKALLVDLNDLKKASESK